MGGDEPVSRNQISQELTGTGKIHLIPCHVYDTENHVYHMWFVPNLLVLVMTMDTRFHHFTSTFNMLYNITYNHFIPSVGVGNKGAYLLVHGW